MKNENEFYIGIDIGHYGSTISYIDQHSDEPVIMDRSGGFGQSSNPTMMAFVEGEWLIAYEAQDLSSDPEAILVASLMSFVAQKQRLSIGKDLYDGVDLMAFYIDELVNYCFQINPKALIKGLVVTLTGDIFCEVEELLVKQLKRNQKFEAAKQVRVVKETDVILTYLAYQNLLNLELLRVFDFGHGGFRCYTVARGSTHKITTYNIGNKLSGSSLFQALHQCFVEKYLEHIDEEQLKVEDGLAIARMMTTYYPYIFKSYKEKQSLKVTYNFAFPPFQSRIDKAQLSQIISPYEASLKKFLEGLEPAGTAGLVIIGNGLKMEWPMRQLANYESEIQCQECDACAKGAALIAKDSQWLKPSMNKSLLESDYGLLDAEGRFIALACKGQLYNDDFDECYIVMVKETDQRLTLWQRASDDQIIEVLQVDVEAPDEELIYTIGVRLTFDEDQQANLKISHTRR